MVNNYSKGKLSKRAVFASFANLGKRSLQNVSCVNEVPDFLRKDQRTSDLVGSFISSQ